MRSKLFGDQIDPEVFHCFISVRLGVEAVFGYSSRKQLRQPVVFTPFFLDNHLHCFYLFLIYKSFRAISDNEIDLIFT